jgi:hypothetical protein
MPPILEIVKGNNMKWNNSNHMGPNPQSTCIIARKTHFPFYCKFLYSYGTY